VGVRQTNGRFEWLVEGAQDAILGLPDNAIALGNQGQLGLGRTYFAANGNHRNNVRGFVKQAYVGIGIPLKGKLTLGRFGFADGTEVTPKDQTLAQFVNTRVAQRMIGEFNFSAIQRSFDGVRAAFDIGKSKFTLLAVRPTRGAFQVDGMGEVAVNLFYGAYTVPESHSSGSGILRLFALGYIDQRKGVVKTDNRSLTARSADANPIRIGTYGPDYAHVFHTSRGGQFNFLLWRLWQNGAWASLTHVANLAPLRAVPFLRDGE
jgi:hypothetical protein